MKNSTIVIEKMKNLVGVELDNELAKYLGNHKSTIAAWRRRNVVPSEVIIEFCKKGGLSLQEFDNYNILNQVREKNIRLNDDTRYISEMLNKLRLDPKKLHKAIGYLEGMLENVDKKLTDNTK